MSLLHPNPSEVFLAAHSRRDGDMNAPAAPRHREWTGIPKPSRCRLRLCGAGASLGHCPPGHPDLVEAAQKKRPEASSVFGLVEHRFDDLFSQAVTSAPGSELEFVAMAALRDPARRSSGPPSGLRSGLPLFIMPENGPRPLGGGVLASAASAFPWRPSPVSRRRADQHRGRDPPAHPSPRHVTSSVSLFSVSSRRPYNIALCMLGIGRHLGAVQRHMASFTKPAVQHELEHVDERLAQPSNGAAGNLATLRNPAGSSP
jgi:hypothetical protein